MPIDPSEMVDYAYQMLQQDSYQELTHRNIVNRAYYGAFLTARDYSKIKSQGGSVHKEVIDYFCNRNTYVMNNLVVLKALRQKADYEPRKDLTLKDARKSCTGAKSILDALSSI